MSSRMHTLELTTEEMEFLLESLKYARYSYEERTAKYRVGKQRIEGYYEVEYIPKISMFARVETKIRDAMV